MELCRITYTPAIRSPVNYTPQQDNSCRWVAQAVSYCRMLHISTNDETGEVLFNTNFILSVLCDITLHTKVHETDERKLVFNKTFTVSSFVNMRVKVFDESTS